MRTILHVEGEVIGDDGHGMRLVQLPNAQALWVPDDYTFAPSGSDWMIVGRISTRTTMEARGDATVNGQTLTHDERAHLLLALQAGHEVVVR